jgi:hypothetical protein
MRYPVAAALSRLIAVLGEGPLPAQQTLGRTGLLSLLSNLCCGQKQAFVAQASKR